MAYNYPDGVNGQGGSYSPRTKFKNRTPIIILIIVLILGLIAASWYFLRSNSDSAAQKPAATSTDTPVQPEPEKPKLPSFDANKITTGLTSWLAGKSGTYSVVITDHEGAVLATHNADETYFAASIYKLYVAYLGYQKIDDGTFSPSTPYANGWTLQKCLDEMIRSSDSPCGERMRSEIGLANLDAKLKTYGLTATSGGGLSTSAADVSKVLVRLHKRQELKPASTAAMLDSMLGQEYRNGLPKGFAGQKVYDKVGFREQIEYHDVAIVELADGRFMTVTVMTKNAGVANIASLAASILENTK